VTAGGAAAGLAALVDRWSAAGLPAAVRAQGRRALLNAVAAGVAGGTGEGAAELEQAVLRAHGRGPSPGLLGRRAASGLAPAAAAHHVAFCVTQNDFDDAHLATIVHPGAAALGGLIAAAAHPDARARPGGAWLDAFALGCEVQLVLACALAPSHYAFGWHSTATTAAYGAATTYGLLRGLDAGALADVLDTLALRTTGLREAHGTLMKGFQVGAAAADGVTAVDVRLARQGRAGASAGTDTTMLLVWQGVTSGISALARPAPRLARDGEPGPAPDADPDRTWELARLTFKPYPAGIVCNAGIDAALALHDAVDPARVEEVEVVVAPLVVELAGDPAPTTEMRARVSLPHAVAVGLLDGRAGLAEFSEHTLARPDVVALRARVRMVPDADLPRASTVVRVRCDDGARHELRVDVPRGSVERPLTDEELCTKAGLLLAGPGPARAAAVLAAVDGLAAAPTADALVAALRGDV
jgi:2-methylcitrate dehydratase PrpD